jgi:DNA (cytosine-5)-methyltransferase 1
VRTMHLFAGVGGGLLADLIIGHTPVCAVELDPYCCAVLRERAAEGWFQDLHVHEGDVRLFDPSDWEGRVDCVAAGFPCQDLSCAGRGAGIGGARSGLWTEVMRVADVVRPRWIFLENVPAIRTRGGEVVLRALQDRGYRCRCGTLAAEDVGAPHRRERWWLLAVSNSERSERRSLDAESARTSSGKPPIVREILANIICSVIREQPRRCCGASGPGAALVGEAGADVGDATGARESEQAEGCGPRGAVGKPGWWSIEPDVGLLAHELAARLDTPCGTIQACEKIDARPGWWLVEPDVGRVAHGIPNRVDRLRACGNGQVPLQAALAWRLLGGPIGRRSQ